MKNIFYQVCFNDPTGKILEMFYIEKKDIYYLVPISGEHIVINSRDYLVEKMFKHYLLDTNTLVFNVDVKEI